MFYTAFCWGADNQFAWAAFKPMSSSSFCRSSVNSAAAAALFNAVAVLDSYPNGFLFRQRSETLCSAAKNNLTPDNGSKPLVSLSYLSLESKSS